MSYSNEDVCVVHIGDAVNQLFPINFDFVDEESVVAELWDVTDPLVPVQLAFTSPADWSVSGVNVATTAAPSAVQKLLLYRSTKPIHETHYSTYEFPYATANNDLDRVFQIAQENKDALNRAILNSQFNACAGGGGTVLTISDIEQMQVDIAQNTADIALLGSTTIRVIVLAGTVTAVRGDNIIVKQSGVTINLPLAPVAKDRILVKDRGGNTIQIQGNGKNIDGAATHTMNSNESSTTFLYDGTEWSII